MRKKSFGSIFCLFAVVLLLMTGCATIGMDMSITGKGSGSIQNVVKLNRAEYIEYLRDTHPDMGMESDVEDIISEEVEQGRYTEEVIDGVEYLVMDVSDGNIEFDSVSDFYSQIGLDSGYELTETSFCMDRKTDTDEDIKENNYMDLNQMSDEELKKYLSSSYMEISVTFDYPVKDTNGTIDPLNSKKVSWRYSLASAIDRIYAYCDSSISFSGAAPGSVSQEPVTLHFEGADSAVLNGEAIENDTVFSVDGTYCVVLSNKEEQKTVYFAIDRTAPELKDASGEPVSFKGWQTKETVVYFWDNGGILSAELDGKPVLECSLTGNEEFVYYVTISPEKLSDGKHKLMVKDTYGNKNEITFKTDKTAPEVKNVKNKKTYRKAVTVKFSDHVSGVKKATLNGKKITSGKRVKKVGNYTLKVTDKAGNSTKVKFKIKEKVKKKAKTKSAKK